VGGGKEEPAGMKEKGGVLRKKKKKKKGGSAKSSMPLTRERGGNEKVTGKKRQPSDCYFGGGERGYSPQNWETSSARRNGQFLHKREGSPKGGYCLLGIRKKKAPTKERKNGQTKRKKAACHRRKMTEVRKARPRWDREKIVYGHTRLRWKGFEEKKGGGKERSRRS